MKMKMMKQWKVEKSKYFVGLRKYSNWIDLENMKKHQILNMVMLFSIDFNKKFDTHLIKSFGRNSIKIFLRRISRYINSKGSFMTFVKTHKLFSIFHYDRTNCGTVFSNTWWTNVERKIPRILKKIGRWYNFLNFFSRNILLARSLLSSTSEFDTTGLFLDLFWYLPCTFIQI
jgi:hypothetical protein